MDPNRQIRFYVSFPKGLGLPRDSDELRQQVREIARRGCERGEQAPDPRVVDRPSERVRLPRALAALGLAASEEVVTFADTADNAARLVRQLQQAGLAVRAGIDLPMALQSWWCPTQGPRLFGDRAEAERLIRAGGLRDPRRDKRVNLVIIDQGLPKDFPFPGDRDGWTIDDTTTQETRKPFQGTGRHAAMVARNALAFVEPANVKLWDCPLLPDQIDQLGSFLAYADVVFGQLIDTIDEHRKQNPDSGSWVLVNAWGVWDTSQDVPPPNPLNYARNIDHALNRHVAALDGKGVDQVFAAGNCGQFCPPMRCGPLNRGPGRSIHGANSHPQVLTVGAVRSDGLWVGYSAEGPGTLAAAKPDLCAPTLFREVLVPFNGEDNSGTSAACGVAAGVVAAARARRPWDQMAPEALRVLLRDTATPQGTDPTSRSRCGAGILNAEKVATLAVIGAKAQVAPAPKAGRKGPKAARKRAAPRQPATARGRRA
ncbi:hypothetical protein E2C06_27455 [Dankookia rubra]|uniref:Peptidase S8/S53 domain-containing protein n=1 Tax=Dankookia rubra TaxID=1442381 RepID=A0A4R5QA40_9PROT|nr:S8 family serine peptidase [Dankookia rubra]TDH59408.1 hypothetical protein E2C06_27455 [Dankookia rubra]